MRTVFTALHRQMQARIQLTSTSLAQFVLKLKLQSCKFENFKYICFNKKGKSDSLTFKDYWWLDDLTHSI